MPDVKQEEFKQEFIKLCEKHGLAVVPSYNWEPSAHDPMLIVPLSEFWLKFLHNSCYTTPLE